jgi:hypothetical protein
MTRPRVRHRRITWGADGAWSQGRRRSMEDDGVILSRSCEDVSLCGWVRGCGLWEGIRAAVILGGEVGRTNEYGPFDIHE